MPSSMIATLKSTCYDESQTLAIVRAVVCLPTCKLKFEFVEWMESADAFSSTLYLLGSRAVALAYSTNVQTEREEYVAFPSCQ